MNILSPMESYCHSQREFFCYLNIEYFHSGEMLMMVFNFPNLNVTPIYRVANILLHI